MLVRRSDVRLCPCLCPRSADEGKGKEADDTPTGVLTSAQVEKGMELELQLAGLDDEEDEIQHRPKRAVKPDDYLQKKTPEQVRDAGMMGLRTVIAMVASVHHRRVPTRRLMLCAL